MSSQQFHRDARAQLYALVSGQFLDEAAQLEYLDQSLSDDGPYVFKLADTLIDNLARLDEDQIESVAISWHSCVEIEALNLEPGDLHEFMFQFIHFCQVAKNDDLGVYLYSDG